MTRTNGMSKPRIVALHGHNSNNDITGLQLAGLGLLKLSDTQCLHAPHPGEPGAGLSLFSNGPWYSWGGTSEELWDRSLEFLASYFRKQTVKVDGIYAFSQGVALITAFSNPKIWRDRFSFEKLPYTFCILACGGGPLPKEDIHISIPSLHILGATDPILAKSQTLRDCWNEEKRYEYTHKGGHVIDMTLLHREPELKTLLNGFIQEQVSSLEPIEANGCCALG